MASDVAQLFRKHGRGPDKAKRKPRGSSGGKQLISSMRQSNFSGGSSKKAVASIIKGKGSGGTSMLPKGSGKTWQGRDV